MIDDRRTAGVFNFDQSLQGNTISIGVADFQLADIFGPHPVAWIGLHVDLPVAILKGKVIDIG